MRSLCPQCGPDVASDEDGCCKTCGATLCVPSVLETIDRSVDRRARALASARWAERLEACGSRTPSDQAQHLRLLDEARVVIGDAMLGQLVLVGSRLAESERPAGAYRLVRAAAASALCDLVATYGDPSFAWELRQSLEARRRAPAAAPISCPSCAQPMALQCAACLWIGETADRKMGRLCCPLCGADVRYECDCGWHSELQGYPSA